ncbi:MAG: hypothetical protein GIW99_04115 [Candidatus Eremiobacteraeota bacterium]|nr:hypothetical protein [Candidatus Eremiobacteraeota bacterium]MBC5826857.1 hypothetical protein [Candidatus Eremiobacteraeota bacterium]
MDQQISDQIRTLSAVIKTLEEMSSRLLQASVVEPALEVPIPPIGGASGDTSRIVPFRRRSLV